MKNINNTASPLLFTQKGAVAIVSINKPPMNPMSFELFDELEVLIPKLSTDQSVRAILITA